MRKAKRPPTPVNIIGGFLGVGKTTAINALLRQKPSHERWAILVNEYGEIGVDEALISSSPDPKGIEVRQLAGGCICCSASFILHGYILILLQQYKPDRLIIEPTGLATLTGILDTLAKPGIAEAVELRSILTLVDPSMWVQDRLQQQPAWKDQVETADILVANRCDLAAPEVLKRFTHEVNDRCSSKSAVQFVEQAELKIEWLDAVSHRQAPKLNGTESHRLDPHDEGRHLHEHKPRALSPGQMFSSYSHKAKDAHVYGWIFSSSYTFCPKKLDEMCKDIGATKGFLRLKGVFHTKETWLTYNATPKQLTTLPGEVQKDSRIECIFESDPQRLPEQKADGHHHWRAPSDASSLHPQGLGLSVADRVSEIEQGLKACSHQRV